MTELPRPSRVLVVEDDPVCSRMFEQVLRHEGWVPIVVSAGAAALEVLRRELIDAILLDLGLPDVDGLSVLREAIRLNPGTPVVIVTAEGAIGSVVEAVRAGARDYLAKPFGTKELQLALRSALQLPRLAPVRRPAVAPGDAPSSLRERMGPSDAIGRVCAAVDLVAPTDYTVILSGETGSGKELVARAIHQNSHRASAPFVPVDCGAIQPNLIESELFGHEKGAFTGADRLCQGKFEAAAGGTLFLDEVQNLPLALQAKFLRALQERQVFRVGGREPIRVDLRVVAASNLDLEDLVRRGHFRSDLFHRLYEFDIALPPLRQRTEDILHLARGFLAQAGHELGKGLTGFSAAAAADLLAYSWPGNVRELRNVVRRAALLADGVVDVDHLALRRTPAVEAGHPAEPAEAAEPGEEDLSLKESVRRSVAEVERQLLQRTLHRTGGNKAKAARLLKIDYKTILTKTQQYGIAIIGGGVAHEEG